MERNYDVPWLTPWEQEEVIDALVRFGLIKFDNNRNLPLKSGGTTDIYINLREARRNPEALKFLAKVFANPLKRLGVEQFVEVPDSVSCFAGLVSVETGLPYITIREQAKEGRVAKAKVIGGAGPKARVAILDDVVTDGASKVVPYRECLGMVLDVLALVVLVDRQQGWRKNFKHNNINAGVWPGMTLHDVRQRLISSGIMERCNPNIEALNPLIIAHDGKSWEEILPIVDRLRRTGCIHKVNDLLFNHGIADLIPKLQTYGRVMADLKSHDIPNTVANIMKHLLPNPPWAVTVHGTGGPEMVSAAVEALKGTKTKVLAVTVLTSIDKKTGKEIFKRLPVNAVKDIARMSYMAGAHGFVSSPEEVGELRKMFPGATLVTPGVRSAGKDADDQKRISTPREALRRGSNYLVMGRQILGAEDPVAEVMRLLNEELQII